MTWRRVLATVLVLVAALLATLAYLAVHLEAPFVRDRVKRAVQEQLHIDIDYAQGALGFSRFELRDLVIASPRADRDLAPELLHVRHIALTWQLADFLPGHQRRAKLEVSDVGLHVVLDVAGVSSVQRFLALLPPTPDKPPTPLSQLFRALHEAPVLGVEVSLHDIHARLSKRQVGGGVQHAYLGQLDMRANAVTGPKQPSLDLKLDGDRLQLEATGFPLDAQLQPILQFLPWLQPLASGTGVLPLGLHVRGQLVNDVLSLTTSMQAAGEKLLDLELALTPDAQKRGIHLALKRATALGWFGLETEFFVNDAMTFVDGALHAHADVPGVQHGGWSAAHETLNVSATGMHLALDPSATTFEKLDAEVTLKGVTLPHVQLGDFAANARFHLDPGVALAGDGSVTLDHAQAHDLAGDATLTALAMNLNVTQVPDGLTLRVHGTLGEFHVQTADAQRELTLLRLHPFGELRMTGLAGILADPLTALRHLLLELKADRFNARQLQKTIALEGAVVSLSLPAVVREAGNVLHVDEPALFRASAEPAASTNGAKRPDRDSVAVTTRNLRLFLDQPLASTGEVSARMGWPLELYAEATKTTDAVSWSVLLDPHISDLVALVPVPLAFRGLVEWSPLHVSVVSEGTATGLNGLSHITQTTDVHLEHLTLPRRARVRKLDLKLASDGSGLRQHADFTLDADVERVGPVQPGGPVRVRGVLDHDPHAETLLLNLAATGPRGLDAHLKVDGKAQGGDLAYTLSASAQQVAAFLRGLPEVDRGALCLLNQKLGVKVDGSGIWIGGAQLFQQKLPTNPDGHHTLKLDVVSAGCKLPQGAAQVAQVAARVDATIAKGVGTAEVTVRIPDLEATAGGHAVRLDGLQQHLTAELRIDGTVHLAADGRLSRLTQDALPGVPLRDLTWLLRGWSGQEGARLEQLEWTNPATGTHLQLTGGYDRAAVQPTRVTDADVNGAAAVDLPDAHATATNEPVPGRLGLNLNGELRQDVGALVRDNPDFRARGVVTVPFRLESGDLVVYHTEARVHFEHVDFGLTKADLQLTDVLGDMPLVEAFTLAPQLQILGGGEDDAYARWRFAEHQPFLRRTDFLSIAKVRYAGAEFGPIAGNAGVDRDVFRMDQVEAAVLHGQLTGQCMVLLNGEDTHVQLRGNATGLQVEGSDEKLDANAALDFLPARRALDGRAEILHIGRPHLLSLLNLWDPYAEDPQSNRLRTLLKLGYPQRVTMRFLHGFMDVGVALGGLGGLVQIDELRGIALGPVFQRWLDPLLDPLRALRVREAPKQ